MMSEEHPMPEPCWRALPCSLFVTFTHSLYSSTMPPKRCRKVRLDQITLLEKYVIEAFGDPPKLLGVASPKIKQAPDTRASDIAPSHQEGKSC
jgi:hypothetical protein